MKNSKFKIVLVLLIVGVFIVLGFSYANNNDSDGQFTVKYDNSWQRSATEEFKLKHKKTGSVLKIQSKILEDNYVDTELEEIIDDIIYSVEQQNKDYKLINFSKLENNEYEGYSYLYEKKMKQVLVNVYKKNNKIVIAYYQADSKVYDIVLDSVDTILNSLEIS